GPRAVGGAGGVPAGGAGLRGRRDRPPRRGVGPRPPLPGRGGAGDGRARPVRAPVPRGLRRLGRRPHDPLRRHRGAGPGRPLPCHHPLGRGRARGQPHLPLRDRGAEAALAPRPLRRASARRVRPDRAGRRERRRRHQDPGGGRRRRVGDRRREGVHHELGHRHHLGHHRDRPDRRPRRRRWGRQGGDQRLPRPCRDPGARGAAPVPEDGLARLGHPRPVVGGLPGAGGQPAREPGPGLPQLPRHPRRGAHRHLRPRPRLHRGVPGAEHRLRRRAPRLRQAHRVEPGGGVLDRRPRGHGRERQEPHVQGGRPPRCRAAHHEGGCGREAVHHRGGGDRHTGGDPGLRGLRLRRRDTGQPVLPGRQDPRDRRGDERDPAPRDQPEPRPARRL
ncbi:MAG: Isovaleryl-CoA dehydrogenase, partial [uncultured Acidimicrobiales bacterium]